MDGSAFPLMELAMPHSEQGSQNYGSNNHEDPQEHAHDSGDPENGGNDATSTVRNAANSHSSPQQSCYALASPRSERRTNTHLRSNHKKGLRSTACARTEVVQIPASRRAIS